LPANNIRPARTRFLAASLNRFCPTPTFSSLDPGDITQCSAIVMIYGKINNEKVFENVWARLTRLADRGKYAHGIIYNNSPEHIDAFDTEDWAKGIWPTPWRRCAAYRS
jgi:hypothetical protein